MDILQDIKEIEARLAKAGVSLDSFLLEVDIHRSNWNRWKAEDTGPTMKNWIRVTNVADQIAGQTAA